jgi:hypothetical protein
VKKSRRVECRVCGGEFHAGCFTKHECDEESQEYDSKKAAIWAKRSEYGGYGYDMYD